MKTPHSFQKKLDHTRLLIDQSLTEAIPLLMDLVSDEKASAEEKKNAGELLMYARRRQYLSQKAAGALADVYNQEYFHHGCGHIAYDRSEEHWAKFFGTIADKIIEVCKPKRVLDMGCAKGFLVEALRDRGVEAYGIDISEYAISQVRPDIKQFCRVGSILDPLTEEYDLIICIEVVEHLVDEDSRRAIENMCRNAKEILFSSTAEDFFEGSHVNVRAPAYWNEIFKTFFFDVAPEADWQHIMSPFARRYIEHNPLKEKVTFLEPLMEKKNVHIQNIESSLAQQKVHIRNIESALAQEKVHTQNMESVLEKQKIAMHRQEEKLIKTEKNVTVLEEEKKIILQEIECKNVHIRNIESLLHQRDQTLQTIYQSRSWRVLHSYATIKKLCLGTVWTLRHQGIGAVWQKAIAYFKNKKTGDEPEDDYQKWIKKNTPTDEDKANALKAITQWQKKLLCSVLIAIQNENTEAVQDTLNALKSQWYTEWDATFAVSQKCPKKLEKALQCAAKKEPRIHIVVAEDTETSLLEVARKNAKGAFILPLCNGAMLAPDALYQYIQKAQKNKTAMIYADEDIIDAQKNRSNPYFKPDWSPHLLLSTMYMGHVWYPHHLVNELGGFHKDYVGSEEYDLALRATEKVSAAEIVHVRQVLIHTRKNTYSTEATGEKALTAALKRRTIQGTAEKGIAPESFRVHYQITKKPLVSIVIPTRGIPLLRTCLMAIHEKTTGVRYEVIVMNNSRSEDPEKKDFFAKLEKDFEHCRVVDYNHPFNFSKINNFGAAQAKGDFVLLLNDDTEPINEEWLSAMVEQAQRLEVGAVGAKLLYPNNTIQHAGVVIGIGDVAGHSHKYLHNNHDNHGYHGFLNMVRDYSAVTAACLMSRRDVFEELHGLDETLAVAFNDVDYCLRVCKAGYSVVYTPYALVFHYESISRGKALNQKEVEIMHARWKNVIQHDPFYSLHLSRTHEDFRIRTN